MDEFRADRPVCVCVCVCMCVCVCVHMRVCSCVCVCMTVNMQTIGAAMAAARRTNASLSLRCVALIEHTR